MSYFDNKKNVHDYIKMSKGYDGAELINILGKYLVKGSMVLELGMGPGKDLDILARLFKATGSDSSSIFLELYRDNHPAADLLLLDARTIETERKFDCIYSNKVLHHLAKDELRESFARQKRTLTQRGLLLHSFWYGSKTEEHHGLKFVFYTEQEPKDLVKNDFEILELQRYTEIEESDSICLLLRKPA